MPHCCNGCCYIDLCPDCIDKSICWECMCCECCGESHKDPEKCCCGKCNRNCCPCCPSCDDFRYKCCVFVCCEKNCIWDPCALCCGPYENDFQILKKKIDDGPGGAPQETEMAR